MVRRLVHDDEVRLAQHAPGEHELARLPGTGLAAPEHVLGTRTQSADDCEQSAQRDVVTRFDVLEQRRALLGGDLLRDVDDALRWQRELAEDPAQKRRLAGSVGPGEGDSVARAE